MEAGEAVFPFQGRISAQQVPVFAAYPRGGEGRGQLAQVCVCPSLLTLRQKGG